MHSIWVLSMQLPAIYVRNELSMKDVGMRDGCPMEINPRHQTDQSKIP